MADVTAVTVITGCQVFDGERTRPRLSVVIAGGLITEVAERVDPPAGAEIVDATGQTLLPGLIDAHAHVFPGSLDQALIFGVTTELDMFADPLVVTQLKTAARSRDDLADLRSAGTAATAPGGHPSGLVERGLYRPFPTLTTPSEAESFVAARAAEGSDYLKIIIDDGHALGYPRPTLRAGTVAALISSAHRHGLLAIVHVMDTEAARTAVEAGADGLAHLPVREGSGPVLPVTALVGRGVFVTPTLVALEAVCGRGHGLAMAADVRFEPLLNPASKMMLTMSKGNFPLGADAQVSFDLAVSAVAELHQAGALILAGTDAGTLGTAHGASLHRELELLVASGLTPVQALTAATAAPARIFGLGDRGRIRPGLAGDLLLVDGDPTTDITATTAITAIWRRGTRVNRQTPRPS